MGKRKLTLPLVESKKKRNNGFWDDMGSSIVGAVSDPIGSLVALAKGQQPTWVRNYNFNKISTFNHRKGFLGGLLTSLGMGYLKNALAGGLKAFNRKSNLDPDYFMYHTLYRHPQARHHLLPVNRNINMHMVDHRKGNVVTDALYNLLQNKTAREIGKKALITSAGIVLPKVINYIGDKYARKIQKSRKR